MPWFVKIEKGIVPKDQFDRQIPAHLQYVRTLNQRGHRAQSGYWHKRGGGMLLFQAANREEAQAIVEQDPLVANHCVEYELHQWCIVEPQDDKG